MTRLSSSSAWRSRLEWTAGRAVATLGAWSKRLSAIPGVRPAAAAAGTLLVVLVSWRAWQGAPFDDASVPALLPVAVLSVPVVLAPHRAAFAIQGGMVGGDRQPVS